MDPVRLYRLSASLHKRGHRRVAKLIRVLIYALFRAVLPPELEAGRGLKLGHHGLCTTIHTNVTIGDDVYIHHGVALAANVPQGDPQRMRIGDRVVIGTHVVVLGPVQIGNDAVVVAGSVVMSDVPAGAVVFGVPARTMTRSGSRA